MNLDELLLIYCNKLNKLHCQKWNRPMGSRGNPNNKSEIFITLFSLHSRQNVYIRRNMLPKGYMLSIEFWHLATFYNRGKEQKLDNYNVDQKRQFGPFHYHWSCQKAWKFRKAGKNQSLGQIKLVTFWIHL